MNKAILDIKYLSNADADYYFNKIYNDMHEDLTKLLPEEMIDDDLLDFEIKICGVSEILEDIENAGSLLNFGILLKALGYPKTFYNIEQFVCSICADEVRSAKFADFEFVSLSFDLETNKFCKITFDPKVLLKQIETRLKSFQFNDFVINRR
ncbi:MAG: hypothetical protein ACRC2J_12710 [Microcoleaceae cyanobacterium]